MSDNSENKAARGSISQIILKALISGDKYGYEIIKDIEYLTSGKLILKQPSLYSCLRRMEEQDLISSYWKDSDIGGKRHYYSLTENGKDFIEQTKDNWSDDEELLNSLPLSDSEENKLNSFSEETNKQKSTFVLNQENLFNLNRFDKEIKKIDAEEEAAKSEENKSFFQFDFFDQNIKFVKENSNTKQELSAFSNKYSDMDNQGKDIEPEKQKVLSPFLKSESDEEPTALTEEQITLNKEDQQNNTKMAIPAPVLKSSKYISRNEVFSTEEDNLNFDSNLINTEISSIGANTNANMDSNKQNSSSNTDLLRPIIENDINPESVDFNNQPLLLDNNASNNNIETISWDFETEYSNKNALFSENDYKSVIGKLYSNSRLEDPYEKNKFQTFKEIFPHSQVNSDDTIKSSNVNENKTNQIEKLTQILKSSEESNIDCEDIKKLNSLYNLQGIQIKIHSNQENKKQTKKYTDKNRLNMVCSWIISSIMILELMFSYFVLKTNHLYTKSASLIYFLGIAVVLSYCLISSFENLFDRFRLVILEKSLKKSLLQKIFIFILLVIAIFTLNLIFGMTSLTEIKYLAFWLIPTLLATNLPISSIVYFLLLKSKLYNS